MTINPCVSVNFTSTVVHYFEGFEYVAENKEARDISIIMLLMRIYYQDFQGFFPLNITITP